jgi:putative hydrolases of HD superfamily
LITKSGFPLHARQDGQLPPLLQAYYELNQLKLLFRQGWLRRSIPEARCESVAEHVFSMALLGWWLNDQFSLGLELNQVLCMILAHELGEIYAGDIIPADQVAPEEKKRREREGLHKVVDKLASGKDILTIWEEYEAGQTAVAQFVRQIDRLEMALQASVYEAEGFSNMDEFFRSADLALKDPALRAVFDALTALRNKAD